MQNQYGEIKSLSRYTNNELAKKKINGKIQLIAPTSKHLEVGDQCANCTTLEDGWTSCVCGSKDLIL